MKAYYVKIHETNKSDPILLITKRRGIILKEVIDKIIKDSGQYYNVPYVSSYSGTKETINLDLTTIEFKNHGSNNCNSIIFSNAINEIAYAIHNSKDILIDAINSNYSAIINDFNILNKKNNNLSIITRFVSLIDVCHVKAIMQINII